jgi:hypothetical protein
VTPSGSEMMCHGIGLCCKTHIEGRFGDIPFEGIRECDICEVQFRIVIGYEVLDNISIMGKETF